ncbi:MAG TPA: CapA family protein [Thermoleophilaceae bacterium]|nr:CapA family protein [Thermoleophilaceae bacterium]
MVKELVTWLAAALIGLAVPACAPAAAPAEPVRLTVAASGDLLIHTPVAQRALALGGGRVYDFAPLFRPVRRRIAGADLALCHVETPLVPGPVQGYPSFRTPPDLARSIRRVGWDACSTASNHSLDAGEYGVATTLRALRGAGVRTSGTARSPRERSRTTMLRASGVPVAFLSYTAVSNGQAVPHPWTVNWASPGPILADARRARGRGARIVIVNLHWGTEYVQAVTPQQRALARRLTRSPAIDAIVGQHAHVVQPIRRVNGKPVVFGEGNLISNQTPGCCAAGAQDGLIALIDFVVRPGRRVRARGIRYVPTWVRHPDMTVVPAAPGSPSWNRTVSVAGRRPGIRPLAAR